MLVADAHQLLSNRPLYVPPSRWYPDIEEGTVVPWTLLALLYVAMLGIPLRELLKFSHLGTDHVLGFGVHCRESLADLRVFLLLLANEELPLVATGDKASPESCRTVGEVAMLGEGRRKSGKREVVNEEERGGKESESSKQRRESKDEERGGRSGLGRRERN